VKKKTITIPEYQEELLQQHEISPSALLREKIDTIIGRMAGTSKSVEDDLIEDLITDE
jgi:hypothetical protein